MLDLARSSLSAFTHRSGRLLSGSIAFYSMLSVAPMMVIALQVAGLVTARDRARAALLDNMSEWIGDEGSRTLGILIERVHRPGNGWMSVLTALVLIYASTRLFANLKRALDILWDLPAPPPVTIRDRLLTQLRKRGTSFGLVVGVGIILVFLVGMKTALAAAQHVALSNHIGFWRGLEALISLLLCTFLFAILFKVLPNARIPWKDALIGAFVTAVLFSVGAVVVTAYLGHKALASMYGDAAAVVILLLWVHYSAQIFLIGAAFTGERARSMGRLVQME